MIAPATRNPVAPATLAQVNDAVEKAWRAVGEAERLAKLCPQVCGIARADLDAALASVECAIVYLEDPERPTRTLPTRQAQAAGARS
jgi:hypothetical protein